MAASPPLPVAQSRISRDLLRKSRAPLHTAPASRLFPSLLFLLTPKKRASSMCPTGRYLGLDLSASVAGAGGDLRPAFDVLDADRDGRISREDLKSFYAAGAAGGRFDDDELAAMIAAADADRDGFVQFDEFERLLARAAAGAAGGVAGCGSAMEDAFRLMDRDGDGRVGFEDLKAYLGWAGMPVADEEVRAMIRVAGGGDGDGGVGIEALSRVLAGDLGGIAL